MKRRVIALIASLSLAGCVTYQKHSQPVFPQARGDRGLLYFYREDEVSDFNSECYITQDDFIVGRLFARSYTFVFSEPGLFFFRAIRGPGIGSRVPVEGGRTYLFRVDLKPIWGGVMGYGLDLVPVTEQEAMSKMNNLTYVSMERNHQIVDSTRLVKTPSNIEITNSPFSAYDKHVIRKIQLRWYALIEKNGLQAKQGLVKVYLQLTPGGQVTNLCIRENSDGEILGSVTLKAIEESAPFAPLPTSLRTLCPNEVRDVSITFRY